MKQGYKIVILLVISLFLYYFLLEIVVAYNLPAAALIVVCGIIVLFGIFDRRIKSIFKKPHNRFGCLIFLFLAFSSIANSNIKNLQRKVSESQEVNQTDTYIYARYNVQRNTADMLAIIFLISYGASRLKNRSDKKNLLKQDIKETLE